MSEQYAFKFNRYLLSDSKIALSTRERFGWHLVYHVFVVLYSLTTYKVLTRSTIDQPSVADVEDEQVLFIWLGDHSVLSAFGTPLQLHILEYAKQGFRIDVASFWTFVQVFVWYATEVSVARIASNALLRYCVS